MGIKDTKGLTETEKAVRRYRKFQKRLDSAYRGTGLKPPQEIGTTFYRSKAFPFFMLESRFQGKRKPRVCIRAGAHGDEYHGVESLLQLLERDKELIRNFNACIFPVGNPRGYVSHNREEAQEANRYFANRYPACPPIDDTPNKTTRQRIINPPLEVALVQDFMPNHFHLAIDLHGDYEETGFFCFERKRRGYPSLAKRVTDQLRRVHHVRMCKKEHIEDRKNQNGVVHTNTVVESTFEDYMFKKGVIYSLTPEFPNKPSVPVRERIKIGHLALRASLEKFYEIFRSM